MFGPKFKEAMIGQGYVPEDCKLNEDIGGAIIWNEVNAGRDPCAGCNMSRENCSGREKPKDGRLRRLL